MKKLIIICLFSLLISPVFSQFGTIQDKETFVQVNYSNGDTISVGKNQVVLLKSYLDDVFIMTSQNWSQDPVTKIASVNYSDFGFESVQALRSHLSLLFFNSYKITYHYTTGLVDTVSYYAGDSLAYKIAYTYSGGVVSEKSSPINE